MTLTPIWRSRLYATGAAFVAVWMGTAIAHQEFALPALFALALAALALHWVQPLPLPTLVLGGVVCGYLIGNRGFAQISPVNFFPLFPAELALLVGVTFLVVQSALRRELPFQRDALNAVLLVWLIIGTGRLFHDVRSYGFSALRDFALVYYAVFFFLAQHAARDAAGRRFLHRCLLVGCAVLLPLHLLYKVFPDFFLGTLTFRGAPLIFYKGDLAGTFLAAGSLLFFLRFESGGRGWQAALSLALAAGALASNNRASMLGLVAAVALLFVAGRRRFAFTLGAAGLAAALVLILAANLSNSRWEKTPLYGVYERALSVFDPFGQRNYSGEDTYHKGDNNLFRAVWWRAVYNDTMAENPWLGLGWGRDLADRFLREYYPNDGDEFSTRSPHNVLLTLFGRLGLTGLLPFLFLIAVLLRGAFRAARAGPSDATALWGVAVIILVSACFCVVLEGPMGAVVFWTALGLANGTSDEEKANPAAEPVNIEAPAPA
jgi:O-antigen ligase